MPIITIPPSQMHALVNRKKKPKSFRHRKMWNAIGRTGNCRRNTKRRRGSSGKRFIFISMNKTSWWHSWLHIWISNCSQFNGTARDFIFAEDRRDHEKNTEKWGWREGTVRETFCSQPAAFNACWLFEEFSLFFNFHPIFSDQNFDLWLFLIKWFYWWHFGFFCVLIVSGCLLNQKEEEQVETNVVSPPPPPGQCESSQPGDAFSLLAGHAYFAPLSFFSLLLRALLLEKRKQGMCDFYHNFWMKELFSMRNSNLDFFFPFYELAFWISLTVTASDALALAYSEEWTSRIQKQK